MTALISQPWFAWALGLALGFPIAVLVLGEVVSRLQRRGNALAVPFGLARTALLPMVVALLFTRGVIGVSAEEPLVRVLATLVWVVGIYTALTFLNAVLFRNAREDSWRANVPTLFLDLSRFLLILVGIAIVMSSVWGTDLAGLLTALGVGSIVLGLALQDTLSNIFAGISILFERPYSEGDWIELSGTVGKVVAINWRATRMVTRDGDLVVVPNGTAAAATILNESYSGGVSYEEYQIGFSYADPPNEVKRILLDTIAATDGVRPSPPPMVRTESYDDSSIGYRVRFAVEDFARLPAVLDDFATRIWYVARRNGLSIPFPIRTVFHYDGDTVDTRSEADDLKRGLSKLEALLPLKPAPAAEDVTIAHFGAGESIIEEGASVRSLYVILSGRVGMTVEDPQGGRHEVTRLGAGELFGGVALLRGQASTCAFSAIADVTVVTLSSDAVMGMVARRPGFARDMEELIEARNSAEHSVREQIRAVS